MSENFKPIKKIVKCIKSWNDKEGQGIKEGEIYDAVYIKWGERLVVTLPHTANKDFTYNSSSFEEYNGNNVL
jgi:hypothetical protein